MYMTAWRFVGGGDTDVATGRDQSLRRRTTSDVAPHATTSRSTMATNSMTFSVRLTRALVIVDIGIETRPMAATRQKAGTSASHGAGWARWWRRRGGGEALATGVRSALSGLKKRGGHDDN